MTSPDRNSSGGMDVDYFRSILDTTGVDVWTFIDASILMASLDHGQELKRRRDSIVERLYATSMANESRNCNSNGGGAAAGVRVVEKTDEDKDEEEENNEHINSTRGERDKTGNGDDDEDDFDYSDLFDEDQERLLEIKEKLENPDQSEETLVELLQNLADMDITFQALQETDIGRHVNGVRKHSSNNVRRLAKQLIKKWKETVDEWVKLNQPGDLEPSALTVEGDSPQQKAPHHGNRQQNPDFGYSPIPQSRSNQPERKPRAAALAKPSPSPHITEINECDLDSARKRLQQNYRDAENAKKQRTIQMVAIHEIPRPKKAFFPRKGGSSHGRHN